MGSSYILDMPIDLSKTGLADKYAAAGVSLTKRGLADARASVYLVLDFSGSMAGFYNNGSVQHLGEQVLALSGRLDDDDTVPVILFDDKVRKPVDVSVHKYNGAIAKIVSKSGSMGSTDYAVAMREVVKLHAKKSGPAFVVFQTDGSPNWNVRADAERIICETATLPIFWQFIGFGDNQYGRFEFLENLDTLAVPGRRPVDNAGFFPAGHDPKSWNDEALYDNLLREYPSWLEAYGRYAGAGALR